jgi:hypothetical protein
MSDKKAPAPEPGKRPYRAPVLAIHGDLRKMTQGKGGSQNDGSGKPKTRQAVGGTA